MEVNATLTSGFVSRDVLATIETRERDIMLSTGMMMEATISFKSAEDAIKLGEEIKQLGERLK